MEVNLEPVYVIFHGCSRVWWHFGKKKGEDINSWSSSNVQVAMPEMSAWSLIIDNR